MILVTGASGHIGRAVVADLVSRGRDAVAMVRNAETARARLPAGLALRIADYDDATALRKAFAGIDELVLISSDGAADAVMRHHANAIDAAVATGIRHIVFTSIIDIGETSPFYYAPVYRDAELRLASSGMPTTVLRCGLYADFIYEHWLAPSQGSVELALPVGKGRVAPISRDDVAAAVAAAATTPESHHNILTIAGDQALDFAEIAACYAEISGRQLHYRSCSTDEYVTAASKRLEEPWPHAFATLCVSIAEGRYGQVSPDFRAIAGRQPESFRDFLRKTIARQEQLRKIGH